MVYAQMPLINAHADHADVSSGARGIMFVMGN